MGDSFRRPDQFGREPQFRIDWGVAFFWIAIVLACLAFWGLVLHYSGAFRFLHGVVTRKAELQISLLDVAFLSPFAVYVGCLLHRREQFKKKHNIRW